jgi:hypothetical protein
MLPARCVQFILSPEDEPAETERVLTLDELDRACAVAVDLDPCVIGIRWQWPEPPP